MSAHERRLRRAASRIISAIAMSRIDSESLRSSMREVGSVGSVCDPGIAGRVEPAIQRCGGATVFCGATNFVDATNLVGATRGEMASRGGVIDVTSSSTSSNTDDGTRTISSTWAAGSG